MPQALAAITTVALALSSQDAGPPQPPVLLRLSTLGPAAWRSRLGPTNLGAMFASAQAEALLRPLIDRADAALRERRGDAAAFAVERARLLDYAGAVQLVVWLEQAEDALHSPRWSAALVVEPDGHTELAALAPGLTAWLARALAPDHTPFRWRDLQLVPPQLREGRLVAVHAAPEDTAAAQQRAAVMRCEPLARTGAGSVLAIELVLHPAMRLLPDRPVDRGWVEALVGPATRALTLELGSAGPQVAVDLSLGFAAGDRGLAAGLFPVRAGVPDLDWLLPPATVAYRTGRADFAALWLALERAAAAATDREVEELRAGASKALGLDVGRALMAKIGDETLLLWWTHPDDHADHSLLADACVVARLRDEAAFCASLRTLLPRVDANIHMTDEDGVLWVERTGALTTPDLCLGAGHGVVAIACGSDANDRVGEVLGRAAAARGPHPQKAVAAPAAAPPGWNSRGSADVTTLIERQLGSLLTLARLGSGGFVQLPRTAAVAQEFAHWLPLLRRHELTTVTTLAGTTADAWRFRCLW